MRKLFFFVVVSTTLLASCKKDKAEAPEPESPPARLVFKFKFDSTQVRLDSFGNVSSVPSTHKAQHPRFNKISAHYIELAQNDFTAVGAGKQLYKADTVSSSGTFNSAIDFSKSVIVSEGQEFFSIPLSSLGAGTYKWLRVSLAYQNYDIVYKSSGIIGIGTVASFIGYNTSIGTYTIKTQPMVVNAHKLQGYWGFETNVLGTYYTFSGQTPSGATTVVNPNFTNSPIPAGSCLVTGQFVDASGNLTNLVITGNETSDIVVTVSLSTQNSFEWEENSGDNYFDPSAGDTVVDMGVRGMIPKITHP